MKLETLRAEDYKVLWQCGYYDGVLSGVMKKHSGEMLYFDCFIDECVVENEDQENEKIYHYRVYYLHKLTDEQKEILIARHNLWVEYSGNGSDWDYRWNPDKRTGKVIDWENYYKEKEKLPEFPEFGLDSVVGYTTDDELYRSKRVNGQIKK